MPPVINQKKCNLCGICEDVCPGDLLFLDEGKQNIVRYPWECDHCMICQMECPQDAITIVFPLDQLCSSPVLEK